MCLVTDRHRLASHLGWAGDPSVCLLAQVEAAAAAGVDLVYLRERDLSARDLARLARSCVQAAAATSTRIIVGDRVDIAVAVGAAGVQLRQGSLAPETVRALVPEGFLVGVSAHSIEEVRRASLSGSADYVIFGTVFPTRSKGTHQPVVGLETLAQAAAATSLPVLGIGGMTSDVLEAVARTGARGLAAIGWFIDAMSPVLAADEMIRRVAGARRLFDTCRTIP